MDQNRKATLLWSLGTIVFSLCGVVTASTADGRWYFMLSAVILLSAGVVFAARAILAARAAAVMDEK